MTDPIRRREASYEDPACRDEIGSPTAGTANNRPGNEPDAQRATATASRNQDEALACLPERETDHSAFLRASSTVPASTAQAPLYTQGMRTNTDEERTRAMEGARAYADAGVTSDGMSAYAGTALVKGGHGENRVDVLGVSVQRGANNENHIGVANVQVGGEHWHAKGEVLTSRSFVGIENEDGSVGLRFGAKASVISGEIGGKHVTSDGTHAREAAVGVGVGIGGDVGLGLRPSREAGAKIGGIDACVHAELPLALFNISVDHCVRLPPGISERIDHALTTVPKL